MLRIMLLNPKGGSGKTTIATTLAGYYASRGQATALIDHDAQGSSTRWLRARAPLAAPIHGIAAYRSPPAVTRSWHLRAPPGTERVIVDTPASIKGPQLSDLVRAADAILVPVLPSPIDIDAVSEFVHALAAERSVRSGGVRVAVVANRVRSRTLVLKQLERFLLELDFLVVTRLRDTRNYLVSGETGWSVHEMPFGKTLRDRKQWAPLLAWVEQRAQTEFEPGEDRAAQASTAYAAS